MLDTAQRFVADSKKILQQNLRRRAMNWTTIKQWWTSPEIESSQQALTAVPETRGAAQREQRMVNANANVWKLIDAPGPTLNSRRTRTSQQSREWRRRALLRKGARLYSTIMSSRNFVSLAMLDEEGVIVAWYERAAVRAARVRRVVKGHVSQLYTPEDVALGVPSRGLCTAAMQGQCVQTGWRLAGDGTKFWATTTIEPARLRDGRLQGFSHLTHRAPASRTEGGVSHRWPWTGLAESSRKRESINGESTAVLSRNEASPHGHRRGPRKAAIAFTTLATLSIPIMAAAAHGGSLPPNATPSQYGSGWDCVHGFRRVNDVCTKIAVPANAYLDASGNRWRCERGYLAVDLSCVSIKVPANAYLDHSYGAGWRCERGYREAKGACAAIQIPANAHEVDSSYGAGWECNYGYTLSSGCQAVVVPTNAHLTRGGERWECDRGFAKRAHGCIAIQLPPHAYIDMRGDDWTCERGFRKIGSECRAVELPANAHLDYSGDRWQCNRGFRDRSGSCIEE
jgi:hypothetical protein